MMDSEIIQKATVLSNCDGIEKLKLIKLNKKLNQQACI